MTSDGTVVGGDGWRGSLGFVRILCEGSALSRPGACSMRGGAGCWMASGTSDVFRLAVCLLAAGTSR